MKVFILIISVLFFNINTFSQILIGEPETGAKEKVEKDQETLVKTKAKKELASSGSAMYLISNWSFTNRLLKPNGPVFGDTLGKRADEASLNTWSFGIGIQNQLNKSLMWDGGISFLRNGESYSYIQSDSTFSYSTTYMYISMPLRLNYTIGNKIKLYAGAGLIPQMFLGYQQVQKWTHPDNSEETATIKAKSGYNPFVLSGVFNLGVMLNMGGNWNLIISPEARLQLTSSYLKQADFIHKSRAYGISFGLVRNL